MKLELVTLIVSIFSLIVWVFFDYLRFENRAEKNMVLGASLIIAIIDTVNNVIINVLQLKSAFTIKDTLLSEVVTIVLLIITEIIIYNKKAEIFHILSSKADRVFL